LHTNNGRRLSFGFERIDEAFPGLQKGDFAALYGHSICRKLPFFLCVRCQLPLRMGGLDSQVVYIDGGNTFDPYGVSAIAQDHGLEPENVLDRIHVSRAFTAYQLTALIFERLEEALKKYDARLVIVSDVVVLFLDKDVHGGKGIDLFKKMIGHLSDLASRRRVIVVASHLPHASSRRSRFLESILFGNADIVLKITESGGALCFVPEKHPRLLPFTTLLSSETVTMDMFMEAR